MFITSCVYQRADMKADMSVRNPKFNHDESPIVMFDSGHDNFHDIHSTYEPFATLLKNDGISMGTHKGLFTAKSLRGTDLLIIANAMAGKQKEVGASSAFSNTEIRVLAEWIQKGGSLLLIADHDPFGSASADLAKFFGVGMQSVWTVDTLRVNSEIGRNTWLEYSPDNGGFGQHSILQGRSHESSINRILTFTGQSLSYDSTWTSILRLSQSAQNYYTRGDASDASIDSSTYFSVPGQSQLVARQYGEGKIVIAGEAAMFTAQEVRIFFKTIHAGFNFSGYDNKELVLNIIHWLLDAKD